MYCYVRDCPNGLKYLKKKKNSDLTKFFPAPEDKNLLEKWRRVVPESENVLSSKDKLCDSHFLPSEVLWFTETKLPNGNVRRLLRDEPILRPGTIPSIFPAERPEKENTSLPVKERQDTPRPIVKSVSSSLMKDKLTTPKSIVKSTNVAKERLETPKSNIRIRFKETVESSGKRNPQRVKRRSTILDDYWTDDELNQVHNPGSASRVGGSAKKRKTESTGLQPVIRLVPLECLMDKKVSKNKTPCKAVGNSRPSTEEIDQELKKVIEIPLLTSLKPNKALLMRSTKDTVQFKPPKKNTSKSKARAIDTSERLISLDDVASNSSEGFNEVKTETPDIEEELARMEMEEENEDVKNSDIVVMNPPLIAEDGSVVVKSEEEDDGYNFNEGTDNPTLNFPEGEEIPTIKSESEEELVPENEITPGGKLESPLSTENSDSILSVHEQSNDMPLVPAEVEQNKNIKEPTSSETVNGNTSAIEADDINNPVRNDDTVAKIVEETSLEKTLNDQEKEKISESREEDHADLTSEARREDVNEGSKDVESKGKVDESAMETESSKEVEPKRKEDESAAEVEKETQGLQHIAESDNSIENCKEKEITKPVESEASQAEKELAETMEDGKDCGTTVVSEEPSTDIVSVDEPSVAEPETNLAENEEIQTKDSSSSNIASYDLPEEHDQTEGSCTNEPKKGETEAVIAVEDVSSKTEGNVIDVDSPEGDQPPSEAQPPSEVQPDADVIIDVEMSEAADHSLNNEDIPVEHSSASQEIEAENIDESAMETENAEDSENLPTAEDILNEDTNIEAHSSPDDAVADAERDTESKKRDNRQAEQPTNDEEMDIEAEVARLVSEVEETAEGSPNKEIVNEVEEGIASDSQQKRKKSDKENPANEGSQPQEIILQDAPKLAAGVPNIFNPETIQEILKQIKLPLTTPVTFRIASRTDTPPTSSSSGRGRGRKKGMRGMNRQVVSRAGGSRDSSYNSIDLFRHLTRTRTVFDFPTFVSDIDDDIQYWKLCQILKESFHELIETRNTKTSIGKLTLRVAINRPKKPKVQHDNGESEVDPK